VLAQLRITDFRCNIRFGPVIHLQCGDVVQLTMLGTESATFYSRDFDLSGTIIESSAPVALHAANADTAIGPSLGVVDSTASQLFPMSAWGTRYAAVPIPNNAQSGYSIRVTSGGRDGTSLTVTGNATKVYVLRSRQALTLDFPLNEAVYIVASAPVQVVQFVRGATVSSDSGAPAALVLPSVENFIPVCISRRIHPTIIALCVYF
jgi:IgGFc binding protein